ncbi:MAG: hypothetical protein ACFFD4_35170, partial [Candidatus Odinarchaeota archaeon]
PVTSVTDDSIEPVTSVTDDSKPNRLILSVKRQITPGKIILAIVSGIITVLIAEPNIASYIINFIVVFAVIFVFYTVFKLVMNLLPIDWDGLSDFIELELMTASVNAKKAVEMMKNFVHACVKGTIALLITPLKFLYENSFRLTAIAISGGVMIFLYFISVEIILTLLGYQYAAGDSFEQEVMGSFTIINLFLVGLFTGLFSAAAVKIWRIGSRRSEKPPMISH